MAFRQASLGRGNSLAGYSNVSGFSLYSLERFVATAKALNGKSKMLSVPDLAKLQSALAETIAWCRLHTSVDDPSRSLRTPELRPSNLHPSGDYDYEWGTVEANRAVVSELAQKRTQLLQAENACTDFLPHDLAGGRLLVASPEESDQCGLSDEASHGFIDGVDVPAWDTWVGYFREPNTPEPEYVQQTQELYRNFYNKERREDFVDWQPSSAVSYILCWIPPQFIAMVEEGISVNPVECFFWAAESRQRHYNTPLLRQLDALGLLT